MRRVSCVLRRRRVLHLCGVLRVLRAAFPVSYILRLGSADVWEGARVRRTPAGSSSTTLRLQSIVPDALLCQQRVRLCGHARARVTTWCWPGAASSVKP